MGNCCSCVVGPCSYSVLVTVATGREMVLKLVETPLKIGITCDS